MNTLGMKFVPVPILGGPTGGQRVLFSVWDTRVQDYEAFVKESRREWPKPDFAQGPTHPAVNVTWEDAQLFCLWLTARDQAAGRLPADWRYRIPSDHEWSCAVGLGPKEDPATLPAKKNGKNSDAFPWGTLWPPPRGSGNYAGDEIRPALAAGKYSFIKKVVPDYNDGFVYTSPVGSFAANQFGLFDMGGNVFQWCEDRFNNDRNTHVLRGACFTAADRNNHLLSSVRFHVGPATRADDRGFRCVIGPAASTPIAAFSAPVSPQESIQTDANQPRIEVLKEQGPNAVEWALAPLEQAVPGDIRQNLTFLREDLLDEGKQKPKASPAAYTLGSQICNTLLTTLEERNQTLVRAGFRAVEAQTRTGVTSDALEARRNYQLSWPQFARENAQRAELKSHAVAGAAVMAERPKVEWATRTAALRKNLDTLYAQFREALRQSPAAK